MELTDITDDKRTPLQKRRVCPIREQYQSCIDLYLKHDLSGFGHDQIKFIPKELGNVGKKLGHHDMFDLRSTFHKIELDALNESTRRNGDPIPNQQINALINSFTPEQWIYFDSEFNTCLLKDLDTKTEPSGYFEHFYGDYHKDFIPAKIEQARQIYDVTFMEYKSFMYWLTKDGREFYKSLPIVERARLNMDLNLLGNWGHFENLGPTIE